MRQLAKCECTRWLNSLRPNTNIAKSSILDEKLGEIYPVLIELKKDTMRIDDKNIKLIPGMTCSVDIKIGKRRLIEYIISPMIRYKDEALREQ